MPKKLIKIIELNYTRLTIKKVKDELFTKQERHSVLWQRENNEFFNYFEKVTQIKKQGKTPSECQIEK